MEGGVAILLIVILLVAGGAVALALSGTGGVLWWRRTDPRGNRVPGEGDDAGERPRHVAPTTPAQERTEFVGGADRPADRGDAPPRE